MTLSVFSRTVHKFSDKFKKNQILFWGSPPYKKQRDDFSVRSHNENLGDLQIAS